MVWKSWNLSRLVSYTRILSGQAVMKMSPSLAWRPQKTFLLYCATLVLCWGSRQGRVLRLRWSFRLNLPVRLRSARILVMDLPCCPARADCLARAVSREISACLMISVSGGWWVAGLGRGWKFHHCSSSSESVLSGSGSAPVRKELGEVRGQAGQLLGAFQWLSSP